MAFWAAICTDDGRVQATQTGGCGFCSGLGMTLRAGISTCSPLKPVNGSSVMQRIETSSASSHMRALVGGVDVEAAELADRRRLTGAELDAAVGQVGRAWRPARRRGPGG